jgi:hypothetical protein
MPGARCTRGLVCKAVRKNAHEHTGSAETLRHSPRNGFTTYAVLSSATNSSCHRHRRIKGCLGPVGPTRLRRFDTSNGCQNHTVLPYAASSFVLHVVNRSRRTALRSQARPTLPRPPRPLPRFVTIAIRPSCRERMGPINSDDLPDGVSGIFFGRGLDRANHDEIIAEISSNPHGSCASKSLSRARSRELNSARVREDGGFRKRH